MGANQSKAPIPNEKLLLERLRALELKDGFREQADDFVHISEKDAVASKKSGYKAPWKTLSVGELESWEHELLQDPKNRYACNLYVLSLVSPPS
jgi:bleomycin hydrolase